MPDSNVPTWLNRCFKVECGHGDDRAPWWTYRRVIAETSQVAECVRIEHRSDGSHVLYLADPIHKMMLEKHIEITPTEFIEATERLILAVDKIP